VLENLECMLKQAASSLERREVDQAFEVLDGAIDRFADDPRPWQMRGCAKHRFGEYGEAIEDLEVASSLGRLRHSAELTLADCYRLSGEDERCCTQLTTLVHDEECPIKVLARAACMLGGLSEHSTALVVCERILEQQPEAHQAWFGVGFYRARLDFSARQVEPFIAEASRLAENNRLYKANLGLLKLTTSDAAGAWKILDSLDASLVRCPNLMNILACVYDRAGQRKRAKQWRDQMEAMFGCRRFPHNKCQRASEHCRTCCVALPNRILDELRGEVLS